MPRDIIVHITKDIHKILQKWFADANAPIMLDEDDNVTTDLDANVGATVSVECGSTPDCRKRKASKLSQPSDTASPSLSNARSFSLPHHPGTTLPGVEGMFRDANETKAQPAASERTMIHDATSVMDLTQD